MQVFILIALIATAVMTVLAYRHKRDRDELTARVQQQGGSLVSVHRVRKNSPFPDTGRGWWAWKVEWRDGGGQHTAWALTTREGLKEWRN